jgi:hypothetical protein
MARCYANENFPLSTVEALRHLGHDVLTTAESGRAGQAIPDADVLAFAMAEQRIVVTLKRHHFIRLHHTTPAHAGIVVCMFDPGFMALAHRIHTALEAQPQTRRACAEWSRHAGAGGTEAGRRALPLDGAHRSVATLCRAGGHHLRPGA